MSDMNCTTLPPYCAVAFKEWAVVCEALASGRQAIILRKGGIHEGREGFRVQHSTFWLYPTNFHQQPEHLSDDAGPFLHQARRRQPPQGQFHLRSVAIVEQVIQLASEAQARALRGLHVWSESTVSERFHYRQAGLYLLLVRVYHRDGSAHEVQESLAMAGCKSWVQLPEPLSTDGLLPALSEAVFAEQTEAVRSALAQAES